MRPRVYRGNHTNSRPECRPEQNARGRIAHVFASLSRCRYVGDYSNGKCYGSAAARSLQDAQQKQCDVVCLEGQADIGHDEDNEADDEG